MARRSRNQTDTDAAAPADGADSHTSAGESAANQSTAQAPASRPRRQAQPPKKGATGRGSGKSAQASETSRLIEALLTSRGTKGASQADLEQVVRWAEGVRADGAAIEAEAAELRKLGPRGAKGTTGAAAAARRKEQRQDKQQELAERRQRQALHQALLEGILSGGILLDVQEGQLLFVHAEHAQAHAL
jgi:hypothetical protein